MKRMMMAIAAMVMSWCVMADTWADPETGIEWTYTVSDGKASVGGGSYGSPAVPTSTTGAITIPSTIDGYPVTSIGNRAFRSCSRMTSVTIPSSVTSVGNMAFEFCESLTDILIPSSVTNIGHSAFGQCYSIMNITLPRSIANIEDGTFEACLELKKIDIPEGVTNIGISAFIGCKALTQVTIPANVRRIGEDAFYNCSSLLSINVSAGNECFSSIDGVLFNLDGTELVAFPGGKTGRYVIPSTVTNIGKKSFRFCRKIVDVTIPEGVTDIGIYAFSECRGLTNVVFGGNAPTVGNYAFSYVASGCTATVYEGTTGWDDDGDGKWQGLTLVWRDTSSMPDLGDNATKEQIADALKGSADEKLTACITNAANYNAYREWAETIGAQAVKDSPNAWVSFALGSGKLLESAPTDEDLKVEAFEPSGEAGKFDFTVSVDGVNVGSDAQKENLKQVFGLEGATSLGADMFSSGNVDLTFGAPENGKVKFTAGPKDTDAKTFFMKVKVNP